MANEATNYLERRVLDFIFKNNALSLISAVIWLDAVLDKVNPITTVVVEAGAV